MYSSTVTHLHTQWHVNRRSQYTPEITPNSQTVKLKFSYTVDSDSLFHQLSTEEALSRTFWELNTNTYTDAYNYTYLIENERCAASVTHH